MDTESTREFLNALRPGVISFERCGSRETCVPPPTDTDEDWVVLHRGGLVLDALLHRLVHEGWVLSDGYAGCGIQAFLRMDETNLLIVTDPAYYIIYNKAKEICKALNLLSKDDRIIVHRILCED